MARSSLLSYGLVPGAAARSLGSCLLLLACAFLGAAPGVAANVPGRLRTFLEDVQTMRANFRQEVRNSNQELVERAAGTFLLKRPGKFAWHYEQPYEQTIIADGENIWFYDPDLEQVTVKPQEEALGETPAMVLSGGQRIEDSFAITALGDQEGLSWVKLRPRDPESTFQWIRVAFRGKDLVRMEIADGLGQTTRLSFQDILANYELADSLFRFEVPAGVDVVGAPGSAARP
jgi:outer membrane lipoprotein carrier protein